MLSLTFLLSAQFKMVGRQSGFQVRWAGDLNAGAISVEKTHKILRPDEITTRQRREEV